MELWKEIPNTNGDYQISSFGVDVLKGRREMVKGYTFKYKGGE